MGNEESVSEAPTPREMEEIALNSHFNPEEVNILYQTFEKISGSGKDDGQIDLNEFYKYLGITNHEFGKRIFHVMDKSRNGNISFSEYVLGISKICERSTIEERSDFVFDVYDLDNSGEITRKELTHLMTTSFSQGAIKLPPKEVARVVASIVNDIDKNGDGSITRDEFRREAIKNPSLTNCVKVHVEHLFEH